MKNIAESLAECPPKELKASWFNTKLGCMVAVGDEGGIYILEFVDECNLESKLKKFSLKMNANIAYGSTCTINSIKSELDSYFDGTITEFKTPIHILGSPFQRLVWGALMQIPYGQTRSYTEQAKLIGKPTSYRAVANANGANRIVVVIPCHRVINANGHLGGYAGGLVYKKWLIDHEKKHAK